MRKRAMDDKLGDTDDSAPANWVYPKDGEPIHALLLLAADNPDDLKAEAGRQVTALRKAGIELVYKQDGMVRPDQRGHEHFGFKDGVSQPGIRDDRVTPRKLSDRQAGQDRIWPGEFIIGYPRQSVPSEEEEATDRGDGEEEEEGPGGPIVEPTPDWTMNGSYLVFRRLRQDVRGFRDFVRQQAAALGLGVDLMGAKLVGRYASGAPLAALKNPANGANQIGPGRQDDPGRIDPDSDLLKSEHINDFEFAELDNLGELVPRGAHIRKVYPRDQKTKHQPGADVKRILRRGIPFGSSYREENADKEPKGGPAFPEDRGLLFICYQNSIADKFEFLQQTWVNDRDFPSPVAQGGPRPGQDPIIAQRDGEREFDIPGVRKSHIKLMERWVTTTGGDYFFSPSIQALRTLA
ncbi:Dyp-type peroxidase [soil metagenome]